MAIAVNKLYSNCASLYQMKLLAGHKGLNNLVEWVHIVEDQEVSSFLHGHELIFYSRLYEPAMISGYSILQKNYIRWRQVLLSSISVPI